MAVSKKKSTSGPQPISPAVRKRLQQWFESGNRSSTKGDYDYASNMFEQCVQGDPGNVLYAQSFLNNLYRKYDNNKKGSKLAALKGATSRGSLKKAELAKDAQSMLKHGLELLKLNPWDVSALLANSTACGLMDQDDTELAYLKWASDANPKEETVNRRLARLCEQRGEFDQAITYWNRVKMVKADDEEALKGIANCTVKKTIDRGGYEEAVSTEGEGAEKTKTIPSARRESVIQRTPEQALEREIEKDPANTDNYRKLAELHLRHERFDEAEAAFQRGLEASGGDMMYREALEDIQLRRAQEQLAVGLRKAETEKTEEAVNLAKRLKAELNRLETQIFATRCERYPTNSQYKYELGVRLMRSGKYPEAIKHFQEARADAPNRGQVFLHLGECFQQIKQYKLAMTNYLEALKTPSTERDAEVHKLSLYRAGVLAMGMKQLDQAEQHFTELAGIDFNYRDVPDRLDKLSQLRDDNGLGE